MHRESIDVYNGQHDDYVNYQHRFPSCQTCLVSLSNHCSLCSLGSGLKYRQLAVDLGAERDEPNLILKENILMQ